MGDHETLEGRQLSFRLMAEDAPDVEPSPPDLIEIYLAAREKAGQISSASVPAMRRDLQVLLDAAGSDFAVISSGQIDTLLDVLREKESPATVRRRYGTWRQFFRWAHAEGHVDGDPTERVPHSVTSYQEADIDFLEPTQVEALLQHTAEDPLIDFVVRLCLSTGVKRKEMMRVFPSHFAWNQDQPMLHVSPTTRHRRAVPIPAKLRDAYDAYVSTLDSQPPDPEQPLLSCTPRTIELRLRKAAAKSGLPTLTLRTLRWTRAILDLRAGVSEERVRAKLGVSSPYWRTMRLRLLPWVPHPGETT